MIIRYPCKLLNPYTFKLPLTYQRYSPFSEIWPAEVINCFYNPNVGVGALVFTANPSVPALPVYACTENQLPPTVEYTEVFNFCNTRGNGSEYIILAVAIGCKAAWYKYGRACFKNSYQYSC